jgi:hypothetical protein
MCACVNNCERDYQSLQFAHRMVLRNIGQKFVSKGSQRLKEFSYDDANQHPLKMAPLQFTRQQICSKFQPVFTSTELTTHTRLISLNTTGSGDTLFPHHKSTIAAKPPHLHGQSWPESQGSWE